MIRRSSYPVGQTPEMQQARKRSRALLLESSTRSSSSSVSFQTPAENGSFFSTAMMWTGKFLPVRGLVSALHPSLAVAAFIHDIEWHESDGSKEKFTESNNRFKTNGYTAAKANYSWWNPLRYIVMNHARRFGNICQLFGWAAWCSPCECAVCKKKRGEV